MQLLVTADCLRVVDEQTKVSDMYFFVVSINSIEIRCVWNEWCLVYYDLTSYDYRQNLRVVCSIAYVLWWLWRWKVFFNSIFFCYPGVTQQCVWKRGIINYNCLTKPEICLTVYQQHGISIESWCEIKWFIGFFIDIGLLLLRSFLRNVDIMDRQFPVCLGYYFTNVKWLYFWFLLFTVIEN